jgi:hypothetical protein
MTAVCLNWQGQETRRKTTETQEISGRNILSLNDYFFLLLENYSAE